jgi:hypothetical protein
MQKLVLDNWRNGFGLSGELSVNVLEFHNQAQEFVTKRIKCAYSNTTHEYRNKINSN